MNQINNLAIKLMHTAISMAYNDIIKILFLSVRVTCFIFSDAKLCANSTELGRLLQELPMKPFLGFYMNGFRPE
jgi:hypothetical protein